MSEFMHKQAHVTRRALKAPGAHGHASAKSRAQRGFTMMELLAVIAIIGVMASLAFISIAQIQKNMQQVELDGTAKEIFIAAQNHLSEAEAQGTLARVRDAEKGTSEASGGSSDKKGVYYFAVVPNDARLNQGSTSMLNIMLPYGSIDATVRVGGTYIIEYKFDTATVLNVYYARPTQTTLFGSATENFAFSESDKSALLDSAEYKGTGNKKRQSYRGAMIGWYGGADAQSLKGDKLEKPLLRVVNAERLEAIVTNPNASESHKKDSPSLVLIVEGETSGAHKTLTLVKNGNVQALSNALGGSTDGGATFHVFLDDITVDGGHFIDNFGPLEDGEGGFIAGENITIRAVAYSNTKLTNIARSSKVRRNSLFASLATASGSSGAVGTASANNASGTSGAIGTQNATDGTNIGNVSDLASAFVPTYTTAKIANIRHLENLSYLVSGYDPLDTTKWGSNGGPLKAEQTVDLSWKDFTEKIASSDRSIDSPAAVHVLSAVTNRTTVVTSSYIPVTLADGSEYNGKAHRVEDVVVNATGLNGGLFASVNKANIHDLELVNFKIASSLNAGALAGSATNSTITRVLAHNDVADDSAYVVSSSGRVAGGLVGTVTGGTISGCAAAVYVSGYTTAGGLIGTAAGTTLEYSYAGGHTTGGAYTGSYALNVSGPVAGGLAGEISGTIHNCYATCSVQGSTAGSFVAIGSRPTGCYAVGAVNGTAWTVTNLAGADLDASTYDESVGGGHSLAVPYDASLASKYGGKYPFKGVNELTGGAAYIASASGNVLTKHLTAHYGDWPAIVTQVVND